MATNSFLRIRKYDDISPQGLARLKNSSRHGNLDGPPIHCGGLECEGDVFVSVTTWRMAHWPIVPALSP